MTPGRRADVAERSLHADEAEPLARVVRAGGTRIPQTFLVLEHSHRMYHLVCLFFSVQQLIARTPLDNLFRTSSSTSLPRAIVFGFPILVPCPVYLDRHQAPVFLIMFRPRPDELGEPTAFLPGSTVII